MCGYRMEETDLLKLSSNTHVFIECACTLSRSNPTEDSFCAGCS